MTAAIIPAWNEAERIQSVLDTLRFCDTVDEIVVVDDGSHDNTAEVVRQHPVCQSGRVQILRHVVNQGKGSAVCTGARAAKAEILLLLDADLIGLTTDHVEALLLPVRNGNAMSVGIFHDGRRLTTLSHFLFPNISGQRAVRRDLLLSVPEIEQSGFGVEISLTRRVRREGHSIAYVELNGVSHAMKEEKLGLTRGVAQRLRMYQQMFVSLVRR